jgi:hypothetical protein
LKAFKTSKRGINAVDAYSLCLHEHGVTDRRDTESIARWYHKLYKSVKNPTFGDLRPVAIELGVSIPTARKGKMEVLRDDLMLQSHMYVRFID